jgi:hypothetical protein
MITHGLWLQKREQKILFYKNAWKRIYNYPCAFFYTDEKLKIEGEGITPIYYPIEVGSWKNKLIILRESVKKYGKAIWLDLDGKILQPFPVDMWDRLAEREEIQIEWGYRKARRKNQTKFWGSFIYCRSVDILDKIINNFKKNDEVSVGRYILSHVKDMEEYSKRYRPYCTVIKNPYGNDNQTPVYDIFDEYKHLMNTHLMNKHLMNTHLGKL